MHLLGGIGEVGGGEVGGGEGWWNVKGCIPVHTLFALIQCMVYGFSIQMLGSGYITAHL